MPIRVLIQIGFELLGAVAVLDRFPEGEVEWIWDGFGGRVRRLVRRCRLGREIAAGPGQRGEGAVRILLEIGFELGRAAVLDALP
jgi:hypothetical protein